MSKCVCLHVGVHMPIIKKHDVHRFSCGTCGKAQIATTPSWSAVMFLLCWHPMQECNTHGIVAMFRLMACVGNVVAFTSWSAVMFLHGGCGHVIYVYGRAGARTATYITRCAVRKTLANHAGPNAQALDRGAYSGLECPADVEHGQTPCKFFPPRCSKNGNCPHLIFDCTYGRAGARQSIQRVRFFWKS